LPWKYHRNISSTSFTFAIHAALPIKAGAVTLRTILNRTQADFHKKGKRPPQISHSEKAAGDESRAISRARRLVLRSPDGQSGAYI
jgi:hypothetical protein